jgi:hypothetical protein
MVHIAVIFVESPTMRNVAPLRRNTIPRICQVLLAFT